MSCTKAQGFLETQSVPPPVTVVDAKKQRFDRSAALALARSARRVLAVRGKGFVVFNMDTDPPDDDTLAAALLGPTGNLKAPALRVGDSLVVGYNEEAYRQVFG